MNFRYLISFIALACSFAAVSAQDGEALYKANCTSCHAIKDKVIGPALKGATDRYDEAWLIKWIRNSQAMVKAGDPKAVKLFNDNNKIVMTSFNLKDEDIKAILAYVKAESEKPEPVATTPAPGVGGAAEEKSGTAWMYWMAAAILLFILAGILKRVQSTLVRTVREKQGLPEPVIRKGWDGFVYWARNNKKLVAVILIFLFMWGSVKGWYWMLDIGVSQGYTPDQPIAYSHQLHAGEMKISCVYCHSGAEKGKTAGVPSLNVCMNCHKFVKKGPTTGTEEIAKIYKALDYDPDKGTYGPNPKPVQWTRVHNLPDLAYFNHAQHYVVGKIECQTCHGQVQDSMTVAGQYSPLTMVWCLDCHKKTPVQMAGNKYYEDYHKQMVEKHGAEASVTVDKIGGMECARCHY